MGIGIAIVPLGEIPVERGNDRVGTFALHVVASPLPDARAARVRDDGGPGIFKHF